MYCRSKNRQKTLPRLLSYWALFLLTFCTLAASTSYGEIISPDRRIAWKPGLTSGIPFYPVGINVKNSPYNAIGDGVNDDTSAIQKAIDDCPNGRAVYIPSGTYKLTTGLFIARKSIVLRGDGPNKTFLKSYGSSGNIITISSNSPCCSVSVTGGYTKGSTSITVSDATSFAAGYPIIVDQANDSSVCERMPSYATRAVSQTVMVLSKSGNTLTLGRPLYYNYNPNMGIQASFAYGYGGPVRNAGIEDLYVERCVNAGDHNIEIKFGINCWVRNVESNMARKWHIRLTQCYASEVRDSYVHHAWNYGGDAGYGVGLYQKSTDCLVENNIMYHLRHSMVIEYGGCGNVFGYNYSKDPVNETGDSTDWLMADMCIHGGHPYMNLFEGNVAAQMNPDNDLGSSRHNTFLRNHATGESIPTVLNYRFAAVVSANNLYKNFVGNVLLKPGSAGTSWLLGGFSSGSWEPYDARVSSTILRHGNLDYKTGETQWDPNITDRTIPNSYYLSEKPAFFGASPWPSIGPDLDPKVSGTPAMTRFSNPHQGPSIVQGFRILTNY